MDLVEHYARQAGRRRALMIHQIHQLFGVTVHPHPRDAHLVVMSETEYRWLCALVERMPDHNIACCYGLGDELGVIVAPDWTCDPSAVAWLRLKVHLFRPVRLLLALLADLPPRVLAAAAVVGGVGVAGLAVFLR